MLPPLPLFCEKTESWLNIFNRKLACKKKKKFQRQVFLRNIFEKCILRKWYGWFHYFNSDMWREENQGYQIVLFQY